MISCPDITKAHLDAKKPALNVVETDIRDAKRRVNLARGPRKNKQPQEQEPEEISDPEEAEAGASESNGEWSINIFKQWNMQQLDSLQ